MYVYMFVCNVLLPFQARTGAAFCSVGGLDRGMSIKVRVLSDSGMLRERSKSKEKLSACLSLQSTGHVTQIESPYLTLAPPVIFPALYNHHPWPPLYGFFFCIAPK